MAKPTLKLNETNAGSVKTFGDLLNERATTFIPGDGTSNQVFATVEDTNEDDVMVLTGVVDLINLRSYPLAHFPATNPVFVPHSVDVLLDR